MVEEARGGILFIDEAYSIVKSDKAKQDSFGREAIDTLMKHMEPPTCVFIFAGYTKEMEEFMRVNAGLARRVPYRYDFLPYNVDEMLDIVPKMCEAKGETLGKVDLCSFQVFVPNNVYQTSSVLQGALNACRKVLEGLERSQLAEQNGGLLGNLLAFAQVFERSYMQLFCSYKN